MLTRSCVEASVIGLAILAAPEEPIGRLWKGSERTRHRLGEPYGVSFTDIYEIPGISPEVPDSTPGMFDVASAATKADAHISSPIVESYVHDQLYNATYVPLSHYVIHATEGSLGRHVGSYSTRFRRRPRRAVSLLGLLRVAESAQLALMAEIADLNARPDPALRRAARWHITTYVPPLVYQAAVYAPAALVRVLNLSPAKRRQLKDHLRTTLAHD